MAAGYSSCNSFSLCSICCCILSLVSCFSVLGHHIYHYVKEEAEWTLLKAGLILSIIQTAVTVLIIIFLCVVRCWLSLTGTRLNSSYVVYHAQIQPYPEWLLSIYVPGPSNCTQKSSLIGQYQHIVRKCKRSREAVDVRI